MQVFNTLGRVRETLSPRADGEVTIYVCGPTVQSAPHVGHGRQAVAFDVIRRYLLWSGWKVRYVSNVTDVEDKIIAGAAAEGIAVDELVRRSTAQFLEAYRRLGVMDPDALPYATEHIDEMLDLIGKIIERGHAYAAGGDVYFSVRSFPGYGKLSGRNIDELLAGARVEPGRHKRDPLDFSLWKASKPGEPVWDSPWGPGRPGWHIECSAMALAELGFGFDIHGGGLDLVFPHHENEIAQSEAGEGTSPFARHWLHNGLVTLRGEKMAKSVGNVVDLLDLLDRHRPAAVRLFYLRAHYRQPIEFAEDLVVDAEASLDRLWGFRRRAGDPGVPHPEVMRSFREAMDADFNTPEALAVLFEAVRAGNRILDGRQDCPDLAAAYDEIVFVLGLGEPGPALDDLAADLAALAAEEGAAADGSTAAMIEALVAVRVDARAELDFARADRIRDRLAGLGILLEDGPDGTTWHRR